MKNAALEAGPTPLSLDLSGAASAAGHRAADFIALTRPRLNLLVVISVAAGYCLGVDGPVDFPTIVKTLAGAALVAAGASALNQVSERDVDRVMQRTRGRPLPGLRLSGAEAVVFSAVLSAAGLFLLAAGADPVAAAIALVALVSYNAVYTPLKRRSPMATLAGAVPGALPPLIGWAAARGSLSPEAWTLFAVMFCWQVPHALAIASIYRDDYTRAGFRLLPAVEPDGRSTARQALLFSAVLIPVSIIPVPLHLAGPWYGAGAAVLGAGLFGLSVGFARGRTTARARQFLLGSIVYLPMLWGLMIANRIAP
jgi:heme o synthase